MARIGNQKFTIIEIQFDFFCELGSAVSTEQVHRIKWIYILPIKTTLRGC